MAGSSKPSRKTTLRAPTQASPSTAASSSRTAGGDEKSITLGCQSPQQTIARTRSDVQHTEPFSLATADGFRAPLNMVSGGEANVLGAGVKDLISTMNELEKLGFSNLDISLAKCVVCGDQSAGKSSVIEAISGIKVPRAAGTCTRCPLFIKLESRVGSQWSAKICIRRIYQYLPDQPQIWGKKFAPWVRKDTPEEVLFVETADQSKLGEMIGRAQLAILNPQNDPTQYIAGAPADIPNESREAEFSPNVVCIYISGPSLPDLSFYDLPGVIITRGNRAKDVLKKFIEDLVSEYISDENALVLLTSSLEIDWDLSSNAAELVAKTGATDRCFGVLTKPDRIDNSARYDDVRKALDGHTDRLGHGYFIVKQPDQSSIDGYITHRQAREQEEAYFEQQEPWSRAFSKYRERFGTLNLQRALSDQLAALSSQSLPRIWDETEKQLQDIDAELARIPRPPSHDVTGIVRDLIREVTDSIRVLMMREGSPNDWKICWNNLRQTFSSQLDGLKPTLGITGQLDRAKFEEDFPPVIDLCNSDDESSSRIFQTPQPITPQKRKIDDYGISPILSKDSSRPASAKSAKRTRNPLAIIYSLDRTRELLHELSTAKSSHQVDPRATEKLMLESLSHWHAAAATFLDHLDRQLASQIQRILDKTLGDWKTTALYHEVKNIVEQFVASLLKYQRSTMVPETLAAELSGPYYYENTLKYFELHKAQALDAFKSARFNKRREIYFETIEKNTGKVVSEQKQKEDAKKEPLHSKLMNDPYAREIEVISEIRAYYQLSSYRFHESICMRLEAQLFKALSEKSFEINLREELQITDENVYNRCVQLLAEDSDRGKRRRNLEDQKSRLLAGRGRLDKLAEKYQHSVSPPTVNGLVAQTFGCENEEKMMRGA